MCCAACQGNGAGAGGWLHRPPAAEPCVRFPVLTREEVLRPENGTQEEIVRGTTMAGSHKLHSQNLKRDGFER